jgi:hypothetical protein
MMNGLNPFIRPFKMDCVACSDDGVVTAIL